MLVTLAAPGPAATEDKTIIVTARTLKDTDRDLAECLARACPPKEDIEASLAHGENLFLSGDFAAARATLRRARDRNLRYARDMPIEVSDLARAYGRMSTFDGYGDVGRIAQIDSLDALKAGLDDGDARILLQRMMVGDEFARGGRLIAAQEIYGKVERQARQAGLFRVLGFAMLRQAIVFSAAASVDPSYRRQAQAKAARLKNTAEPELAEFRDALGIMKVRLAALAGDEPAIDAAIIELARRRPASPPVLVYAPSIDLDETATTASSIVKLVGDAAPQWIDIAFEILQDGRVGNIDVLRQSANVKGVWPQRVRDALGRRRYTPPAADAASARVERFAIVYDVGSNTGSRIRARSPVGRIVTLDLTVDP